MIHGGMEARKSRETRFSFNYRAVPPPSSAHLFVRSRNSSPQHLWRRGASSELSTASATISNASVTLKEHPGQEPHARSKLPQPGSGRDAGDWAANSPRRIADSAGLAVDSFAIHQSHPRPRPIARSGTPGVSQLNRPAIQPSRSAPVFVRE